MADHSGVSAYVVVGASAGGVEALKTMFAAARPDTGLSFVVLLHLGAGSDSALTEILARICPLPVRTATSAAALEPDCVFVIPPGMAPTIAAGHLVLAPSKASQVPPHSIDTLLTSLAHDARERAIGVILSGMGEDGTRGCKSVRDYGGFTVAQAIEPAGGGHNPMPQSAIDSGFIDVVLPAGEIIARLADYAAAFEQLAELTARPADGQPEAASLSKTRAKICVLMLRATGHDFAGYKERSFMRRVQRRMQILQILSLDAYLERLESDSTEAQALFRECLIGVTAFFRDPKTFAALQSQVLPALFEHKTEKDSLRAWVAGCSTGEEAYSIAMLLCEYAATLEHEPRLMVFATDIDDHALRTARTGRYTALQLTGVSPERLARFFLPDGEDFVVSKELRDICVFSPHNLVRDPPFSRLDLVSCRNLLIYIDTPAQRDILPLFHFALRTGGVLLLGSAESAEQFPALFDAIDQTSRIYRRRDYDTTRPQRPLRSAPPRAANQLPPVDPHRPARAPDVRQLAEARILSRFAPAFVVVDRDAEIVHFSPNTGRYLEPPGGKPTRSLIALARRGMRLELRTALTAAARTGKPVTGTQVTFGSGAKREKVMFSVEPLATGAAADGLFLVVFLPQPDPPVPPGVSESAEAPLLLAEREADALRGELQVLVEEHETTVQELRASNEEMMSVNEEFQSTNEELETSKEEQQSANEELQSVNTVLQAKLEELDRLNLDLRNLFDATEIATLTLSLKLTIKSFAPAMTRLLNLLPTDTGRPITDITGAIDTAGLVRDATQVMATNAPVQTHISVPQRRAHYLQRSFPYRRTDGQSEGVLISFVDVTQLVEALAAGDRLRAGAARAEAARAELDRILANAPMVVYCGIIAPGGTLTTTYLNRGIERLTGRAWNPTLPSGGFHAILTRDNPLEDSASIHELLQTGERRDTFQIQRADQSWIWLRDTRAVLARQPDGNTEIVGFIADITTERAIEARMVAAARLSSLGEMAAGLAHELKQPLQTIILAADNAQLALDRADLPSAGKRLESIVTQAQRGGAIIEHLRSFALGSATTLKSEPIAVDRWVANALAMVSGAMIEARVTVQTALGTPPPMVMGKMLELEQVLTNLLLNARDAVASLPDGVDRQIHIRAETDADAGKVRLIVSDNGGGIAPEILPRLFEPFQTTKGPDKGTGLGLSICRGLLHDMAGGISVNNQDGGAAFTVTLPLQPPA